MNRCVDAVASPSIATPTITTPGSTPSNGCGSGDAGNTHRDVGLEYARRAERHLTRGGFGDNGTGFDTE